MPQGTEFIVVIAILVLLFGGSQIPKLAKSLGSARREFKGGLTDGAVGDKASDDERV